MKTRSVRATWLAAVGLTLSCGAMAAGDGDEGARNGFAALEGLSLQTLEQTRGREGRNLHLEQINVQSIQDMEAVTAGSRFQIINGDMVTGNITFESGSMGHYSGTGIFNNVTGNANAINNAIGISVYVANP